MSSFVSTGPGFPVQARDAPRPSASLSEALFQGLAPDGGLFMPARIPRFEGAELDAMARGGWPRVGEEVARRLLGSDLDPVTLKQVVDESLDFPIPLVPLTDRIFVLELFRGPTLAFKDVGARFMARLMATLREDTSSPLTVLTATSGDTGGAVAHAFLGLAGVRVVVLFPEGKVTPRQERQFSTLGGNVHAVAVQGDFDDCQRMAKAAFRDPDLSGALALTSANSINVGRFLPQSFYYFHALGEVGKLGMARAPFQDVLFSVPSGNFGNLAAGLLMRAMGPRASFLAATNANDEVPQFLETGRFRPRPSVPTLSTAMDVGDPSNLARILHLYGHELDRLRRDVAARSISDEETRRTIRKVHGEREYLLDPHSAVGYRALEEELKNRPGMVGVLLATAHPAKFAEVVEPVIGEDIPIPHELARCLEGERVVTPLEPEERALRKFLLQTSQVTN